MTKIEALELELAARKMVEGTSFLEWVEVLRDKHTKAYVGHTLPGAADDYELALGIIEGKPVWRRSRIWVEGYSTAQYIQDQQCFDSNKAKMSWNPPKPKTGMVELLVEDIEYWCQLGEVYKKAVAPWHNDASYANKSLAFYEACRKTLETLK